jgi:predicted membrane protein
MMRKNGSSALKSSRSVIVVVMMGPVYVHACAVRRAKLANVIGRVCVIGRPGDRMRMLPERR